MTDPLAGLAHSARLELTDHILPYWAGRMVDRENGGFVGRVDGTDRVVPNAPKGAVLNARILWTFAVSARTLGDESYARLAHRAYGDLHACFRDTEHGGVFWSVTADGQPLDTKKQTYAQAFAIYALAEYARLVGQHRGAQALGWAQEIFGLLETHAVDPAYGGYLEALGRAWGPADDVRLSDKDLDAPKSMNTHLHVMEAYATLYAVAPTEVLGDRLRALIGLFLDRIVTPDGARLGTFFALDWTSVSDHVSFGHDIEAAWLLDEAAEALGDEALIARVRIATVQLAQTVLETGLDTDGALFNEGGPDGVTDTDKHWWPQAEAVVGFLNAYGQTDDPAFAWAAVACWDFVQRHVVDRDAGEWFFRVSRDGTPYRDEDKAGPWKCPYHNGRACLEVMHRVASLELVSA